MDDQERQRGLADAAAVRQSGVNHGRIAAAVPEYKESEMFEEACKIGASLEMLKSYFKRKVITRASAQDPGDYFDLSAEVINILYDDDMDDTMKVTMLKMATGAETDLAKLRTETSEGESGS